jgi:hypothetical protein
MENDSGYMSHDSNSEHAANVAMEDAYPGCFHSDLGSNMGSEEGMDQWEEGMVVQVQEPRGEAMEIVIQEATGDNGIQVPPATSAITEAELALLDVEFDPDQEWDEGEILALLDDVHVEDKKVSSLVYIQGHPGSTPHSTPHEYVEEDDSVDKEGRKTVEGSAPFKFVDPYFLDFLKWTKEEEEKVQRYDIELGLRMERIRKVGSVTEETQFKLSTEVNSCLVKMELEEKIKSLEGKLREATEEMESCRAEFRVAKLEGAIGMAMARQSTSELEIKKCELIIERHKMVGLEAIINTLKYQTTMKDKELEHIREQMQDWKKAVEELQGKGIKRKWEEE